MKFCNYEECPHYARATKYDRACYYGEPMCWKGWLDLFFGLSKLFFKKDKGEEKQ